MFSGIIEQIGVIERMKSVEQGVRLWISSPLVVAPAGEAGVGTVDRERVGLGDSIAVFGVCLTVEEVHPPHQFVVVCGRETMHSTMLGTLTQGSQVHLERALRLGDRLDGHMVQGHADGVGTVVSMENAGESWILWVRPPADLSRYIAVKGSITIAGVSLTVNDIQDGCFRVNIIPHTIKETLLHTLQSGTSVNLEVDVIARYLERMLTVTSSSPSTSSLEQQLRAWGHGASRSGG
jgi:riboflavin synthase